MARTKKIKEPETIDTPAPEIVSDEQSKETMFNDMLAAQGEFVATDEPEIVETIETPTQENKSNTSELDNDINESFNELLSPELIISVFNSVVIVVGKLVCKAMGLTLDENDLSLSYDEQQHLKPIVKRYLLTLDLKLSPLAALLISVGMVYATKIPAIIIKNKGGNPEYAPKLRKSKPVAKKRGPYNKKVKISLGGE